MNLDILISITSNETGTIATNGGGSTLSNGVESMVVTSRESMVTSSRDQESTTSTASRDLLCTEQVVEEEETVELATTKLQGIIYFHHDECRFFMCQLLAEVYCFYYVF